MRVGIPLLRVRTPLASAVKNARAFVMTKTISDDLLLLFISFQMAELENKSHLSRPLLVRPSLFVCGLMKMMNCGANVKCQTVRICTPLNASFMVNLHDR